MSLGFTRTSVRRKNITSFFFTASCTKIHHLRCFVLGAVACDPSWKTENWILNLTPFGLTAADLHVCHSCLAMLTTETCFLTQNPKCRLRYTAFLFTLFVDDIDHSWFLVILAELGTFSWKILTTLKRTTRLLTDLRLDIQGSWWRMLTTMGCSRALNTLTCRCAATLFLTQIVLQTNHFGCLVLATIPRLLSLKTKRSDQCTSFRNTTTRLLDHSVQFMCCAL